jgi:hypothetical protein
VGWNNQARWISASASSRCGTRSSWATSACAHVVLGACQVASSGEAEHRADVGVCAEGLAHAGTDVAGGVRDDDVHSGRFLKPLGPNVAAPVAGRGALGRPARTGSRGTSPCRRL